MASIHTNSIREELTRIKDDFAIQSQAGKVPSESAMLIKSLIMLIELLFSIFLEKTTKKNSRNSSKPLHMSDAPRLIFCLKKQLNIMMLK